MCETELQTSGPPVALRLTPHTAPGGIVADGADMALIDVEVVDAKGRRCPTALNPVSFLLSGPAEWRGGIAQAPDNGILAKTLPVECGVNRVILRSTPEAGKIVLEATSPGLSPARVEFSSKPFSVENGLSAPLPGAGLTADLSRGPTPVGSSLTPTRTPISIASATAGSAANQAAWAFDDNEKTSWKSAGGREKSWIEFALAKPARVSELTLKLGGWRTRSYPIRVLVDGKEVFSGKTSPSLGYVTLPVKAATGKTVRIELSSALEEKDAFDLVEVTGKKLPDAAPGNGSKDSLEIVEAEIYGPVHSAGN